MSIESSKTKNKENKDQEKKKEQNIKDFVTTTKDKTCLMGVPEREGKKKGTEEIFETIITKNIS